MTEQPAETDAEIIAPTNEKTVAIRLRSTRRWKFAAAAAFPAAVLTRITTIIVGDPSVGTSWAYIFVLCAAISCWMALENMTTAHDLVVSDYNGIVGEFNEQSNEYNALYDAAQDMADEVGRVLDINGPRVPEEDVDEVWQALKAQLEGEKP